VRDNDIRGAISFAYAERILIESNHIWGYSGEPYTGVWLNTKQWGPRNLKKPIKDIIIRNNVFDIAKVYFSADDEVFENIAVVGNTFNNGFVVTTNINLILLDNVFKHENIYDDEGNRLLRINYNAIGIHADETAGKTVTAYMAGNTVTSTYPNKYSGIDEGYLNLIENRAEAEQAYNNILNDFDWVWIPSASDGKDGLGTGAIVGIVIGSVGVFAVIVFAAYYIKRTQKKKHKKD
jgi:hypothetical protein